MCIKQTTRAAKFGGAAMKVKLSTGFAHLDEAINGLPREGCLIYLVGLDHGNKSRVLDNMAVRLLDYNNDVIVFLHTVKDRLSARIAQIKGVKSGCPSKYFKRAGYYLKNAAALPLRYRNFEEVYHNASAWISRLVNSERLILADIAGLPPQLPALELWIRAIRTKFPNKSLVVLSDNFHLYDLPGYESSKVKAGHMDSFVKRLTTQYRCTIFMPVQLSSEWSIPGKVRAKNGSKDYPVTGEITCGLRCGGGVHE